MIIDYRSDSATASQNTELCIVGAGPAGITMALELAALGKSVLLLESGGDSPTLENQQLYKGENIGQNYMPLDATRLRMLGGSTGHWSGYCAPMTEFDFADRPWIPNASWPVTFQDVSPYYEKAQPYFQIGPANYDPAYWSSEYTDYPEFDHKRFLARFFQFSTPPLNFGAAYKDRLLAAVNITVLTNVNVTNLNLSVNGRSIESVDIQSLEGKAGVVTAKRIVLACGGIENARLLLASNDVAANGIGNDNDVVGRYFMEHVEAEAAKIYSFDANQMRQLKRHETQSGHTVGTAFCVGIDHQQAQQIGHGAAVIAAPGMGGNDNNGYTSLKFMREAIRTGEISAGEGLSHIVKIIRDFDTAVGAMALGLRGKDHSTRIMQKGSIDVISLAEQTPNADSRVVLSDAKDVFDNPLANLDWKLSDIDRKTVRTTMILLATELNRLNLGQVQLLEWIQDEKSDVWSPRTRGGNHHMGTTRMSDNPNTGVVDANCKVFEIDNLYIAGSSVFSTGSYTTPTLTIVAFAVRLAEHLNETT